MQIRQTNSGGERHQSPVVAPAIKMGTEAHLKSFEDNAARIDPPVLRVDRHCMNCADNKAKTLNAFKMACLTHTQSPIPYQGQNYHVSDLLSVKAEIVAKCQRMIRENLF